MRYATRTAVDRVNRALQNLAEKLDLEPESEEFQATVAEVEQTLHEAERDYHHAQYVRRAA